MNCILLPAANFSSALPSTSFASALFAATAGMTAYIDAPAQIKHITSVLKAKVGDTLKIGQLNGHLGSAIIDNIGRDCIQLSQVQLNLPAPPKLDVSVILALPRPKVLRRLIMDMTALGVRKIILINSYRTQKSYWQSPMLQRLDEFVLEGLQQGVDTVPPPIELQKRFKPFVEDELASLIEGHAIVAHPYSELSFAQYLQPLQPNQAPVTLPSVVCIGSEGGWIDYEIELLAKQGCQALNIGQRILRTEAAVNVILGQWLIRAC